MNIKSFLLGILTGVIGTIAILFVIGIVINHNAANEEDPIRYLDHPTSYENKTTASFQVFQVLDGAALANEKNYEIKTFDAYHGNVVLLLGDNYYDDQKVTLHNPQHIGNYSYQNRDNFTKTVPVIEEGKKK